VRIPLAWLLSKVAEPLAKVTPVPGERYLTGAALVAHPLTKCRQQNWIINTILEGGCGDDPGISQICHKLASTMDHPRWVRVIVVWASASTQVVVKSGKGLLVQLAYWYATPTGQINEVFCRSEVSASDTRGVARLR
jgi:hypothetical protein